MALYRQKQPLVIDADQYTGKHIPEGVQFAHPDDGGQAYCVVGNGLPRPVVPGDWIVTNERGARSVIPDAMFQETFELVPVAKAPPRPAKKALPANGRAKRMRA
jgi:hypothetical protein